MSETGNGHKPFIPRTITADQAKDTGMAMALICLLIGVLGRKPFFISLSIPVLLMNMIWPGFYRPAAKLWIGLSNLLGTVVSTVLLTILFFIMVTPVGMLRRMSGRDSLQLNRWRKDRSSVFKIRNHTFTAKDITAPY